MSYDGDMATQMAMIVDDTPVGEIAVRRMVLPFLPPSKNQYDGWPWQWQSGAKKKWYRWIEKLAMEQDLPQGLTKIGLSAKLWFPTNNRRDPQNYAGPLWNFVPDALQACGVLQDDRDGAIEFGANLGLLLVHDNRTHVPKKKRQRTELAVSWVALDR